MSKPREFFIRDLGFGQREWRAVCYDEEPPTDGDYDIHVIEHSAYQAKCEELDKLKAENERLSGHRDRAYLGRMKELKHLRKKTKFLSDVLEKIVSEYDDAPPYNEFDWCAWRQAAQKALSPSVSDAKVRDTLDPRQDDSGESEGEG